jgi:hypothetical protein
MIGKIVLPSLFLFISISLFAEEQVVDAGNDYKLTLPSDWVEIPEDVLDQYEKAILEATKINQTYEYGYQSNTATNWFEYPYALVQVNRQGRVPEGQLKQYEKVESGFKEGMDKVEAVAGDLLSNAVMGETIYDQDSHILWSKMSMDISGIGRVKGLIAIKLTEYGTIQFMGYAKEDNFTRYEAIYREIIHSITVQDSEIYTPRITDNAPTIFGINLGQLLIAGVIGALVGGIIGLFIYFTKRKS